MVIGLDVALNSVGELTLSWKGQTVRPAMHTLKLPERAGKMQKSN
jgi:hypothetical protein